MEGLLGELALAHVELANARDGIVLVNHSGSLALGLGEHNVHKLCGGGDHLDPLEVIQSRHGPKEEEEEEEEEEVEVKVHVVFVSEWLVFFEKKKKRKKKGDQEEERSREQVWVCMGTDLFLSVLQEELRRRREKKKKRKKKPRGPVFFSSSGCLQNNPHHGAGGTGEHQAREEGLLCDCGLRRAALRVLIKRVLNEALNLG